MEDEQKTEAGDMPSKDGGTAEGGVGGVLPGAGTEPSQDGGAPSKEEEYLAGWKRAQADYANLKKETERLRGEYAKYAAADTIERLLPVLDALKKATAELPDCGDNAAAKAWIDGIGHVKVSLENALRESGISVIEEKGVPFDPSVHDALMREPSNSDGPDRVVRIIEPGYRLHDRVIRPAKVVVSQ